jgi:hypothetical protein
LSTQITDHRKEEVEACYEVVKTVMDETIQDFLVGDWNEKKNRESCEDMMESMEKET